MNLLSFILFVILQLLFIPLAIIGLILVTYKQMVVSKQLGSSQTAIEVLNGRWIMHIFGIRKDEAAVKLANNLPNTSTFGLWLVLFPLWVKYKVSGHYFLYPRIAKAGQESLSDMIVARTRYFDNIIADALPDIEQFVILGAGYDTRAYGGFRAAHVAFFELDQQNTQAAKKNG